MPRAFITGASGFVGPWLCQALLQAGWDVVAGSHDPEQASAEPRESGFRRNDGDLRPPTPDPRPPTWVPTDVRDSVQLARVLNDACPDAIFHLAGVSYVPAANADPGSALEVNVTGAARLVAAVAEMRDAGTADPVVLVVGSGLQYGAHPPDRMPLSESTPQEPRDVYAASKAAQEQMALAAWRGQGVRVIAVRSFNHSGPGQSPHFLLPRLVRDALALRASGGDALQIGNVGSVRDFLHVADVARAYVALAEQGEAGEAYNVASGVGRRADEAAERVLALSGVDARLDVQPALQRAADVALLVGDAAKLRAATEWSPQHSFDTIIEDLIRAASR
ncbi:MAG TPA: GDP-mannose 4,6-dehydratase [Gemmatimonadaceae bacterium]|nr:GDP-mannose 4,6-dehydratase [Gemmatimonadaceae bacterium]